MLPVGICWPRSGSCSSTNIFTLSPVLSWAVSSHQGLVGLGGEFRFLPSNPSLCLDCLCWESGLLLQISYHTPCHLVGTCTAHSYNATRQMCLWFMILYFLWEGWQERGVDCAVWGCHKIVVPAFRCIWTIILIGAMLHQPKTQCIVFPDLEAGQYHVYEKSIRTGQPYSNTGVVSSCKHLYHQDMSLTQEVKNSGKRWGITTKKQRKKREASV